MKYLMEKYIATVYLPGHEFVNGDGFACNISNLQKKNVTKGLI
jgi:hypothetical protein